MMTSPHRRTEPAAGVGPLPRVALLDGGEQAYPRMLEAIDGAKWSIRLEAYAFSLNGVGGSFIEALAAAAQRRVHVQVSIDGWGSARDGRAVAAALRLAGCHVTVHNRLLALLVGRAGRNHRKILVVDDDQAFLGGLNIGDENVASGSRPGWADLCLQLRGVPARQLSRILRGVDPGPAYGGLRLTLCRLGGGWRLRRRYLEAFAGAKRHIFLAHGYFLPDAGVLRALTAAAQRGVQVRLLLAGRTDVPLALRVTRRLYPRLLAAGILVHEWKDSVLHSKAATIDGERLLLGSFNLDPFSLANWEALAEVNDPRVVAQAEHWIKTHTLASRGVTAAQANERFNRWVLDPVAHVIARVVVAISRVLAWRRT